MVRRRTAIALVAIEQVRRQLRQFQVAPQPAQKDAEPVSDCKTASAERALSERVSGEEGWREQAAKNNVPSARPATASDWACRRDAWTHVFKHAKRPPCQISRPELKRGRTLGWLRFRKPRRSRMDRRSVAKTSDMPLF